MSKSPPSHFLERDTSPVTDAYRSPAIEDPYSLKQRNYQMRTINNDESSSYQYKTAEKIKTNARSLRESINASPALNTSIFHTYSKRRNYFVEGQLFRESNKKLSLLNGRFGPKEEKQSIEITKALMEKKLDNAYDRFLKRSDKASHYYNQNFNSSIYVDDPMLETINNQSALKCRRINDRETSPTLNQLSKSISQSREFLEQNEIFNLESKTDV